MSQISAKLQQLQQEVQQTEAGENAAIALLEKITNDLGGMVQQGDLDAIDEYVSGLATARQGLASAVATVPAGQPVGGVSPPSTNPTPSGPTPSGGSPAPVADASGGTATPPPNAVVNPDGSTALAPTDGASQS